jgi:hypothetical protein
MREIGKDLAPVEQSCLDTGIACNSCQLAIEGVCGYLQRGKQWAEDREFLDRSSYDDLIDGYYTNIGVERLIAADPELAQQIVDGKVGMAAIDIRGVKAANDEHDYDAGNGLILVGAQRLPAIRSANPPIPHEPERRAEPPSEPDIRLRGQGLKSDELATLMRNVHTKEELEAILNDRILPAYSVEQAIIDSKLGLVPVVANGAAVHSSEFTSDHENIIEAATDIFRQMTAAVVAKLKHGHNAQYELMWETILAHRNFSGKDIDLARPVDERGIINIFWPVCCPDFYQNARDILLAAHRNLSRSLNGR